MVGGVSSKQLQGLIHTALQRNYDVRIAATRILQAQAQVGVDLTQLEHPELFAGGGNSTCQALPSSASRKATYAPRAFLIPAID
jgi:multidrug efflux system outer membrane protein